MSNFRVEKKTGFRLIAFKTPLSGASEIHSPEFSPQKTKFFLGVLQDGSMATLRPLAEAPYGYGAITVEDGQTFYYAGVQTTNPAPEPAEEVLFPDGDYVVLSGGGGLSRLAFDRLEDQVFDVLLKEELAEWVYTGTPVAEILLNGNPQDSEVEVWVPVSKRA
jgi:predicted transcriptional regulator YdeE